MYRTLVIVMTVAVLQFVSPVSSAEAASLSEHLAGVAQNPYLLQQVIQVKQDLEQGNKNAAISKVVSAVVANTGNEAVASLVSGGNLRDMLEVKTRQEIEQQVFERLGPYQTQIAAVAKLLNRDALLNPAAVQDNDSLAGAPAQYKKMLDMTATAYGPGPLDNGIWKDKTYLGGSVQQGVAAVDPNVIPMGAKLWVEGYGAAIAEDQGSAIKGNRIDLAFNTRSEALDYGIQKVKVYVLE